MNVVSSPFAAKGNYWRESYAWRMSDKGDSQSMEVVHSGRCILMRKVKCYETVSAGLPFLQHSTISSRLKLRSKFEYQKQFREFGVTQLGRRRELADSECLQTRIRTLYVTCGRVGEDQLQI